MNEEIISFGENNRLTGIMTYPVNDNISIERPAVIMLNAGLVHRIGPFRFYVDLARLFAEKNFITLRFDLSGLGDSTFSTDNSEFEKYAITDTDIAMDYITSKTGIKTFVLLGLCSGADNIHAITKINNKVIGCILLDAYGYPTRLFSLHKYIDTFHYYLISIFSMDKWISFFKKKSSKTLYSKSNSSADKTAVLLSQRNWPEQNEAEKDILDFIKRGIKLLYIYSGGVPYYYNYRKQFYDMFPSLNKSNNLFVKFFPKADHTYTSINQRKLMLECICSWLYNSF
jgi:hypothetical protein